MQTKIRVVALIGVTFMVWPTHSELNAAVLTANQATYVRSNASSGSNFGTAASLEVANRSNASRKAYTEFDVSGQLDPGQSFSNVNFSLTVFSTPLIGASTGNVTFTIYGLTNGASWAQNSLTWDTANTVGNDITSPTAVLAASTTNLGTITIDTTTVGANQVVSLSSTALTNYLNWAAGNLGNFYSTGVTSDLTPTFIITAQGSSQGSAGVSFWSDSAATTTSRPSLSFAAVPEPGSSVLVIIAGMAGVIFLRPSRKTA